MLLAMPKIEVIEGAGAKEVADWVEEKLRTALAATEQTVAITVPGGSTPFPIFELLAAKDLDWHRISIWPGDDRIVPEDHPASNSGKMRSIFEPVGAEVIHLMSDSIPPSFALAWLGMGGDGHIASLFPNTDPKADDPESVRILTPDPLPPEAPFDRITLTIPVFLASAEVVLVLGSSAEKRSVFEDALAGANNLPIARLLRAIDRPLTCFT